MQFDKYGAEDFLLDESFRNYCLENNEADVEFWERWISGNPGKVAVIREAKELFRVLNGNITAVQFKQDQAAFAARLQQHLHNEAKPSPLRRIFFYVAAAAASVLLFVFISKFLVQPGTKSTTTAVAADNIYVSNPGEKKSFQLPDGSKVQLNSGSTIKVSKDFNASSREISLKGEAYFDVAKNEQKPFIIHAGSIDIKVLGTVFNIKAYEDDRIIETALFSGAVEVTLLKAGNKKIVLKPNQKVTVSQGTGDFAIKEMDQEAPGEPVAEILWTKNRLAFVNNTFEEIATTLERWYGVQLIFDNESVKQFRFTATFDRKSVEQVLEALKLSRPFTYKVEENNKIHIRD